MIFKYLNLSNLLKILAVLILLAIINFVIEPYLHYHNQHIGFYKGFSYFQNFLSYPGGLSNYVAEFVSQFFKFNLAGSLIIVFIAVVQAYIAVKLARRMAGETILENFVFYGVLVIGVIILCDYRYPYYATIRLLFAYLFVWMFCQIDKRLPEFSVFIGPMLVIILFYLSSGAATIMFAVSASLVFISKRGSRLKWLALPVFITGAGLVPLISNWLIFPTVLKNLFRLVEVKPPEMLSFSNNGILYLYFLVLPLLQLGTIFFRDIRLFKGESKESKAGIWFQKIFSMRSLSVQLVQLFTISVVGWFVFVNSFNLTKKKLVLLDYLAQTEKWDQVLKLSESFKTYDFRVNYQVNRAYAHQGTLSEHLFDYPQLLGSKGLFLDASTGNGSFAMPISDLYFDLGFMSESLHWAFEAQTLVPNSPRILKRIILIYIINEKFDRAQKFLNVLSNNILYKEWVKKYLEYVENPEMADGDELIVEKRSFSPKVNEVNLGPFPDLKLLINTNHDNKMAYDYMISLCLLDSYNSEFVGYLKHFGYYGIKTLPRVWGEALAFYIVKNKTVPAFVTDETVGKAEIERLRAFNAEMAKYGGNFEQARSALRESFGNTYWYYLYFLNPRVTNVLNSKSLIK